MLKVTATEYILDFFPGAVQFHFTDAYGVKHELIEKLPVLGFDDPDSLPTLPFEFEISFEVLERLEDGVAKVEFPYGISDEHGNSVFYLREE